MTNGSLCQMGRDFRHFSYFIFVATLQKTERRRYLKFVRIKYTETAADKHNIHIHAY